MHKLLFLLQITKSMFADKKKKIVPTLVGQ